MNNSDRNFQKSTIKIKKCKNCQRKCSLLYDHHHDEHFSEKCGTVVMQAMDYLLEYRTDPCYWEKEYAHRRELKEIQKEKEQIQKKLEDFNKKYTITKDQEIQIHNLQANEKIKIIYLCKDTHFKLIKKNITQNGQLKEIKYIIKQKNREEIQKMKKEQAQKEKKKGGNKKTKWQKKKDSNTTVNHNTS